MHLETEDIPAWVAPAHHRLPDSFGLTAEAVSRVTSPEERMPAGDLDGYLITGQSALKAIR
jgi:hypothetical protein